MLRQSLQTKSGLKLFIRQPLNFSLLKNNHSEAASNASASASPKSENTFGT